jgi:hypothetical protein
MGIPRQNKFGAGHGGSSLRQQRNKTRKIFFPLLKFFACALLNDS